MAAPKKGFKNATKASSDVINSIVTEDDTPKKKKVYSVSLIFPDYFKPYLQTAAFNASTPANRVSVTEYIRRLIEADMKKHPEWRADDAEK